MRIAWFVYGDLDQPTGGYIYDRIVVSGLRAAGDDVTVIDPRSGARAEADALVGDALCVPELGPLFERTSGAPRILLVHHMPSWEVERGDRETLRGVEQRALRAADAAIVTSLLTAERLRAEAPALPIATVTPGADRWPRPEPVKGSGLRLLSVGSLVPRKRLDLVLDALEQVADGRVSLTVAGDPGRDPAYARAIAARVGASPLLGDRVALRGVIPDESLARAMSRADALVLASSLEGYGMVVAEALHAGVPVLVSRAAAGAAGVVDGAGARVFDDAPSLAAIVAHLARDSVARAALRRSARSWVAPRWADSVAAFRAALVARVSGRGA